MKFHFAAAKSTVIIVMYDSNNDSISILGLKSSEIFSEKFS
jgi:hypothetical protein